MPQTILNPLFWKMREYPVHFLGSIHFGRDDGYGLPEWVMEQFESATAVNFETRNEPSRIPRVRLLRSSGTLADDLGSELYSVAQSILGDVPDLAQMSAEAVCYYHLCSAIYRELNLLPGVGVDSLLHNFCATRNKRVYGLESEDQSLYALFADCSEETSGALRHYLRNPNLLREEARNLVTVIESGDISGLASIRAKFHSHTPRKAKLLFSDRETRWIAPIERLLATNNQGIVVAGALHFAEPDGLLSRLRSRGYEFDRVEGPD